MAALPKRTHSSKAALRSMPYSTAPVRHLPEINEGLPDRATAIGMVARPATRGLLSGNDAINAAGQTAVLVGRHTFVQKDSAGGVA
jgi:hypothetical protein